MTLITKNEWRWSKAGNVCGNGTTYKVGMYGDHLVELLDIVRYVITDTVQ